MRQQGPPHLPRLLQCCSPEVARHCCSPALGAARTRGEAGGAGCAGLLTMARRAWRARVAWRASCPERAAAASVRQISAPACPLFRPSPPTHAGVWGNNQVAEAQPDGVKYLPAPRFRYSPPSARTARSVLQNARGAAARVGDRSRATATSHAQPPRRSSQPMGPGRPVRRRACLAAAAAGRAGAGRAGQ